MSYAKNVLSRLGGIGPAAKKIKKAKSTVQGWWDSGKIPDEHKPLVADALRKEGQRFKADDFLPEGVVSRKRESAA